MTNQNLKPEESFVSAFDAYIAMTKAYDSIKITDVLKNHTSDLNTAATEVVKSMSEIIHHTFCHQDDELESFAYELLYKRLERGSNKDRIRLDVLSEYESGDHALAVFKTFLRNNVMNDYYRTENKRISKFDETLQKDSEGKEYSNLETEAARSTYTTRSQRQYITSVEDIHLECADANHRVQRTLYDAVTKMCDVNPIAAYTLLLRFNRNYDLDVCTAELVKAGEKRFKKLFFTEVVNLCEVFDFEEYDWLHVEINAKKIAKFYNALNSAISFKQQMSIVANKASRKNYKFMLNLPNGQWLKKVG